jgi:hypothetical protein
VAAMDTWCAAMRSRDELDGEYSHEDALRFIDYKLGLKGKDKRTRVWGSGDICMWTTDLVSYIPIEGKCTMPSERTCSFAERFNEIVNGAAASRWGLRSSLGGGCPLRFAQDRARPGFSPVQGQVHGQKSPAVPGGAPRREVYSPGCIFFPKALQLPLG